MAIPIQLLGKTSVILKKEGGLGPRRIEDWNKASKLGHLWAICSDKIHRGCDEAITRLSEIKTTQVPFDFSGLGENLN